MSRWHLRPLSFLSCWKFMRHLYGQMSQVVRPGSCDPQVHGKPEFYRLLNWKCGRAFSSENPVDIRRRATKEIALVDSISDDAASIYEVGERIHCQQTALSHLS